MMKKSYLIDRSLILMTGEYDPFGKLCARVMVENESFLVDRSPVQLLDETLLYLGFDFKGANNGARFILGNKYMCPIMVNPYQVICLFPDQSPQNPYCIWFNYEQIVDAIPYGKKTEVILSNGCSIIVDARTTLFKDKIQAAFQLQQIAKERGTSTHLTPFQHPQKRHQISKDKTGNYNFISFDTKKAS